MEERIRVVVAGACGKMGKEVIKAVLNDPTLTLVGTADVRARETDFRLLTGVEQIDWSISTDLESLLQEVSAQVLVDFTNPQSVLGNIKVALDRGVSPVVGTTGLLNDDLEALDQKAREKGLGLIIAPNFALGAVLLMKFARDAARYFPHAEIIELHHDQKVDAPSGTALRTADLILEQRPVFRQGAKNEYEKIAGARGGEVDGIHIHSVRLPGFVAHEEVIFGGLGQILTLRHDSINRECFMPGVLLAIHEVLTIQGLVLGLDQILED